MAGEFRDQALVMLRGDEDVRAGKRDALLAFAPVAARFRASRFRGRRNFAVAHGDFALMEIFDAERIAEGLRELFKFEHLARVGLLMDAVQSVDAASEE